MSKYDEGYTYNQDYSMQVINYILIVTLTLIFTSMLLKFALLFFLRRNEKRTMVEQSNPQSYVYAGQSQSSLNDYNNKQAPSINQLRKKHVCSWILDIIFWLGILFLSLVFPLLSGFEFINIPSAIFINIFLYLFGCIYTVIIVGIEVVEDTTLIKKAQAVAKQQKNYLMIFGILFLFFAILLPFIFDKSCICYHNDEYGMQIGSLSFSTKMTRHQWLPDQVCPKDKICHVYATLPSQTSTAVFINAHTSSAITKLSVRFNDQIENSQNLYDCLQVGFPSQIEEKGQRNVFTCLVTNLKAGYKYEFQLLREGQDIPLFTSNYRTLPARDTTTLQRFKLVFGGDFGNEPNGRALVQQISKLDPDLILIGGDISYDNGYNHCYYSWDTMLNKFEEQFSRLGRVVPFLFCVGNHDVGFHSMRGVNITVNEENGPLYFNYFPQMFKNELNQTGVPDVQDRISFNKHFIGNFLFMGLDSGYLQPQDGLQLDWIKFQLEAYSSKYQAIPFYHNPMFPGCFKNSSTKYNWDQLTQIQDKWMPIFDQFNIIASFEHHVHVLKRTFPIKNGTPQKNGEEGTVYFGDGSMGVESSGCESEYQTSQNIFKGVFSFEKQQDNTHIWFMETFPSNNISLNDKQLDNTLQFTAYDYNLQKIEGSYYQISLIL